MSLIVKARPKAPTLHRTIFPTSGTFTTPANSTTATVYKFWGRGAGAGGAGVAAVAGNVGQGGSGAGFGDKEVTGIAPNTAITVTIGGHGAGGAAGANAGGNGGTTTIGAPVNVTLNGGTGGQSGVQPFPFAELAGGTATGGDLNFSGGVAPGTSTAGGGCDGSPGAVGAVSAAANFAGVAAVDNGCSGSGGASAAVAQAGGNGVDAIVTVEWVL